MLIWVRTLFQRSSYRLPSADILKTHKPDAVMHFCADSIVPFSVKVGDLCDQYHVSLSSM